MYPRTASDHAVRERLICPKAVRRLRAEADIDARNGGLGQHRAAKAHKVLEIPSNSKWRLFRMDSAEIACSKGSIGKFRTANDHTVLCSDCDWKSEILGIDSAARASQRGRNRIFRTATAHAVFDRYRSPNYVTRRCTLALEAHDSAASNGQSGNSRHATDHAKLTSPSGPVAVIRGRADAEIASSRGPWVYSQQAASAQEMFARLCGSAAALRASEAAASACSPGECSYYNGESDHGIIASSLRPNADRVGRADDDRAVRRGGWRLSRGAQAHTVMVYADCTN